MAVILVMFVIQEHCSLVNFVTSYPSLACLTAAGHHSDCLKLVNNLMVSDGPTSDLYIMRAGLHKLLNQVTTPETSQVTLSAYCIARRCL